MRRIKWYCILKDALFLLLSEPTLFIPKLLSVTLYVIPYLLLFIEFEKLLSTPYYSLETVYSATMITLVILLLSPIWIFLDALYPPLVKQLKDGEKTNMRDAMSKVWKRFPLLLAFLLLSGLFLIILASPFILVASYGITYNHSSLLYLGFGGMALILLLASTLFYFTPTSILLGRRGLSSSFWRSIGLVKRNIDIAFLLSVLSFLFFASAFFLEGAFQTLGLIGFVAGRYLGGLITVYLYVVNPDAYLSLK